MTPVFVLVGPPAVGKSTAARALAVTFPKSLHVPVDDLRHMVVSGLVLPGYDWPEALREQVALARASALEMAERYRTAGFAVVLDDFLDPNGLAEYREVLSRSHARGVVLLPSEAEAQRRNLQRAASGTGHVHTEADYIGEGVRAVYGYWPQLAPKLESAGWAVLDTTELSAQETVAAVLALG